MSIIISELAVASPYSVVDLTVGDDIFQTPDWTIRDV